MNTSTTNPSKRRRGRFRNKIARRLEILEDRTLLNASIDIDADGLLTYKTDGAIAETLKVSVAGDVYTFDSDVDIDVPTNVPGLTVTGEGTATVTVTAISGLVIDSNRAGDLFSVSSSNVVMTINLNAERARVVLGAFGSGGLGALSAPITVAGPATANLNDVTLFDPGSAANTTYTLTPTTLTANNGFGGLTYTGVSTLRVDGSRGENEFIVQGTADNMAMTLVGNSLRSNTFDFKAASSPIVISSNGTGAVNSVKLGNAGVTAGLVSTISVENMHASVDIAVDNSAGTTADSWKLMRPAVSNPDSLIAELTGFSGGGSLQYVPGEINTLSLAASTGRDNILVVGFRRGNPLPSATGQGSLSYNGGGGDPSGVEVGLVLQRGEFDNETHDALSSSSGRITLEVDGVSSTISYDDLGPRGIYDVVAATNYTFNNLGDLTVPVVVKDSALSLLIANTRALWISVPGSFIDTHVSGKRNITINAGSSSVDGSVVVDYRSAYPASPFSELETLTIVTSDGEGSARLLGLPPNVVTTLRQGTDDDQATISIGGLNQAAGATLDGGGGANTLTIDASGGWLAPERFSAGPGGSTVVDAPVAGGPITYSNYQQVLVTNLAPSTLGPAGEVFRAVQDKAFVDVVVGRFFSSAPGAKASDFDATIDWGDGSPADVGSIVQDPDDPSVFYVRGTHLYAGTTPRYFTTVTVAPLDKSPKEFTRVINGVPVTFITSAGREVSAEGRAEIIITDLPARPPHVVGRDIMAVQGQRLDDVAVATFTSNAPGAKASDFDATIDWGDGSPAAVGSIVQDPDDPSVFYVTATHTYYESAYSLRVKTVVTSSGTTFTEIIDGVPVDFHLPPSGPVMDFGLARVIAAPATLTVNSFTDVEYPAPGLTDVVLATFSQPGGHNPADPNPAARYVVEVNWGDASGAETIPTGNIVYDKTTDVFTVIVPRRAYTRPGSYKVFVAVSELPKSGGTEPALARESGVAHIVDAPLSAASPQPTIPDVLESSPMVDQIIGSFTDANPLGLVGEFTAMIDWGDGSPLSPGKVIQPGGPGQPFFVVGSHVYAADRPATSPPTGQTPAPGPVTADGTYPIRIHVQSAYGSAVDLSNIIRVVDRPMLLVGLLNPASDSGVSNTDAVTNVVQPNFFGAASEAGAVVFLYATPQGGAPVLLGRTTVALNGAWSITPGAALADGAYAIQAQAYDASGHSISALTTIAPNLVIDTIGPRIADARLDFRGGRAVVAFEDFGGASNAGTGLVHSTLVDANNYQFSLLRPPLRGLRVGPRWPVTAVGVQPGTSVGPQLATVRINNGRPIRPGRYLLGVASATLENPLGVRDVAGNALEGQTQWPLTPANRIPIRPVSPPRRPGGPAAFRFATMRGFAGG